MFMFVFSVITISIVGLFFQIVSAQANLIANQQVGMGMQMLKWHSLATVYACTDGTVNPAENGQARAIGYQLQMSDLTTSSPEIAGSYQWNTVFFSGTYNGAPASRMIVTYVTPTEAPSGYAAADVARQLNKVTTKQQYRFARSNNDQVTLTTFYNGVTSTLTVTGLSAVPVPNNSVVLVTDVSGC